MRTLSITRAVCLELTNFRAPWRGAGHPLWTMAKAYKPEAYTTASPYLIVDGAARTIQILKEAFGATELRQYPGEGGKLMHAEVRIDDSVLMLADAVPSWPALNAHVHVYVSDVDATYRRALSLG